MHGLKRVTCQAAFLGKLWRVHFIEQGKANHGILDAGIQPRREAQGILRMTMNKRLAAQQNL